MTKVAIIGCGRAATLHAEAARVAGTVDLIGIAGRSPGRANELAAAAKTRELPFEKLVKRAKALVVAVPPSAVADVLDVIPDSMPVLVESPPESTPASRAGMTAANLLHAPDAARALAAIRQLGEVHHVAIRTRTTTPSWGAHADGTFGGGPLAHPGAGVIALLLAATASPVRTVAAETHLDEQGRGRSVSATLRTVDGRAVRLDVEWTPEPGANDGELEAAGAAGVVHLRLWPRPELEIDGRPVAPANDSALAALGFVEQIQRFAMAADGDRSYWPPLSVGAGVAAVQRAAMSSADAGGVETPI